MEPDKPALEAAEPVDFVLQPVFLLAQDQHIPSLLAQAAQAAAAVLAPLVIIQYLARLLLLAAEVAVEAARWVVKLLA